MKKVFESALQMFSFKIFRTINLIKIAIIFAQPLELNFCLNVFDRELEKDVMY